MKKVLLLSILIWVAIPTQAQQSNAVLPEKAISDMIGFNKANQSKSVTIGHQIWATKNLDVITFRNGDPILHAQMGVFKEREPRSAYEYTQKNGKVNAEVWSDACQQGIPAWTYIDSKHPELGKYYNSFAVHDKRGLAPEGWHVPTKQEWDILYDYLGGNGNAVNKLTSKIGWRTPSNLFNNKSGFSALPLGYGNGVYAIDLMNLIRFWAWGHDDGNCIFLNWWYGKDFTIEKTDCVTGCMAVRCIKGNPIVTDSDSQPDDD